MRKGKKFSIGFLPTLLVLVSMLVVACGGGGGSSSATPTAAPAKAAASQQVLRIALPVSDIATFDPGQESDLYSAEAIYAVFTGLVQLNDQLQVKPQLATNWTSSTDGLTWTFTLKSGLKFSDGTPITSADVVYSIDRALSPQISAGIDLTPNLNYYGRHPQLTTLSYLFYKSSKTQYEVYQAGQLDQTLIPSANFDQVQLSKEFSKTPLLAIDYYAMNYLAKPFDNIHIRQAFSLAINRDLLMQAIFKGRYIPTCHIVPSGMPGYNPNLQCPGGVTTRGDPAKAKQMFDQGMQEAGYTLATFPTVTMTYSSGSADRDNLITTVRQMWKTVLGIDVKAQAIDFNQLVTDLTNAINNPKGLQMWDIGWIADYPDPQDWTTLQFDKGSPNNYFNYGQNNSSDAAQQQQVQQQLEQADVTANQAQRLQLYNQAEQQLVNDVAWLSIDQESAIRLVKPYAVGLTFNANDLRPPDSWANVYIAAH